MRTLRLLPKFETLWGTCLLLICGLVFASIALQVGFKSDFSFPTTTGGDGNPSGEKPESKLWFNDGFWWASMWSNSGNAYHIHRLDLSTQNWVDTGTAIDTRNDTKADALWDEASDQLYIVSHVYVNNASTTAPAGQRGQLYRYSYNFGTNTYTLDSGFPVEVNDSKSESLVLEKDSTGRLWVTYPRNQQVVVNHSDTDGLTWGTPFVLPTGDSTVNVNSDDISSIVAFGTNVGVLWSDQGDDTMYFSVHPDSAAPASGWSSGVAAGGGPGTNFADDHISLKALPPGDPAGQVMAVTKTSESNPRVTLLVCKDVVTPIDCKAAGDWTAHTVFQQNSNYTNPTRGILLIDSGQRKLYVLATASAPSREIYYKLKGLDSIGFTAAEIASVGTPFIQDPSEGANDLTSAKHLLSGSTDLIAVATDSPRYLHNYLDLGDPPSMLPRRRAMW